MQYLFLSFHLLFALFIFFLTIAFITGAPFVPSTSKASRIMIDLAEIKRGMHVYDLGSGDGRLLFLTEKKGARATGYEINPFLVVYTKIKMYLLHKKNIEVHWKNFWSADIRDADIVFVYLLPWKMDMLEDMLKRQLKPHARIVSNSFIFPNFILLDKDDKSHVFVFSVS